MSYIPTPEQAEELVKQYNKEPFHIEHAEIVSKIMGIFAEEYDPDRVQFWETVGMLHSCIRTASLLMSRLQDGVRIIMLSGMTVISLLVIM